MSRKQEIVSDAAFKTWPFSSDFNFACKNGWVTTTTWKYYCTLVVNTAITSCCKELHLKCSKVPRSVFENITMHKNYSCSVWKPVFSILYCEMFSPLLKIIVFLCYFVQFDEVIFDQPFRRLLPLLSFHGSSKRLLKVSITCKWVNLIKK